MKRAIIIGAGPAGLTAAYKILKTTKIHPVLLEESNKIGGISRTVIHNGNRMDIGGHRFFSKSDEIMDFWKDIMPIQGSGAWDDLQLDTKKEFSPSGPNPETEDRVMLIRHRVSRILYQRMLFDYPISISLATFTKLGVWRILRITWGYLFSTCYKRKEKSLKDFMTNRFGAPLYETFFEKYTEKVWGRNPDSIDASWGKQRIKGLSLWKMLITLLGKSIGQNKEVETSLIEEFLYPKKGPGQLWEAVADSIREMGGEIVFNARVESLQVEKANISSVSTVMEDGSERKFSGDYIFSSMPLNDFIAGIGQKNVPPDVYKTASELPFRDFITVGLLVDKLLLKNTARSKSINNTIPDCWIYIQEEDVKIGRLQIFNNWSPYMIEDPENTIWLGLEYFCTEGDELWNMPEKEFIEFATSELEKINVLKSGSVISAKHVKVKKAYPAYFDSYSNFSIVRDYLNSIENLYCIGRNGQHRYNNMDHSMLTAIEAVKCINKGKTAKEAIWKINTECDYHEEQHEES